MADSIEKISLTYSVYMINCESEGYHETTCRFLFAIDMLKLFAMFAIVMLLLYLIKSDRHVGRHEE